MTKKTSNGQQTGLDDIHRITKESGLGKNKKGKIGQWPIASIVGSSEKEKKS
jgi:hypothetical protein